jgi:hypothetical protein
MGSHSGKGEAEARKRPANAPPAECAPAGGSYNGIFKRKKPNAV